MILTELSNRPRGRIVENGCLAPLQRTPKLLRLGCGQRTGVCISLPGTAGRRLVASRGPASHPWCTRQETGTAPQAVHPMAEALAPSCPPGGVIQEKCYTRRSRRNAPVREQGKWEPHPVLEGVEIPGSIHGTNSANPVGSLDGDRWIFLFQSTAPEMSLIQSTPIPPHPLRLYESLPQWQQGSRVTCGQFRT